MAIHLLRKHLGRSSLLLSCLASIAPASATEPLHDQIVVGSLSGHIFPSECCWMPLPPSDKLAAMKRAEFPGCSAIGGPVGVFEYRDRKLWLTSLYKCSGAFDHRQVYPALASPAFADWLSGSYTLALGPCGHDPRLGRQAYAHKQKITVVNGVVTAMSQQDDDGAFCAAQDRKKESHTMREHHARYDEVIALHEAGRYAEALALIEQQLAEIEREAAPDRSRYFMPMFQLKLLLDVYPPARAAMMALRDAQAARLLAGERFTGTDPAPVKDTFQRTDRYSLVVGMNNDLGDARSTYDIFRQLAARQPELAGSHAWQALEAMIAVGDFALADRYRRPPLDQLPNVNATARDLPLFPRPRQAPRLSADLSSLVKDVRIGMAVLRGLGDPAGADALRAALLDGLVSDELKEFARRELDEPGAIGREVVARQMAEEDRQRAL